MLPLGRCPASGLCRPSAGVTAWQPAVRCGKEREGESTVGAEWTLGGTGRPSYSGRWLDGPWTIAAQVVRVSLDGENSGDSVSWTVRTMRTIQPAGYSPECPSGGSCRPRRGCAFKAATMVDTLMAIAPTLIGKSNPHGTKRPAATGMASKLYPAAQTKFCTIFW